MSNGIVLLGVFRPGAIRDDLLVPNRKPALDRASRLRSLRLTDRTLKLILWLAQYKKLGEIKGTRYRF